MTATGFPDWTDPRQPQGNADLLLAHSTTGATGSGPITMGIEQGIYKRYWVQFANGFTAPLLVTCSITTAITGMPNASAQYIPNGQNGFFAPYSSGIVGSQSVVTMSWGTNIGASNVAFSVYGMREFPDSWSINGRPPCQNSLSVGSQQVGPGTTIMVAAPTSPQRILLGTLELVNSAGTAGNGQVTANVNGTAGLSLGALLGNQPNVIKTWPMGVLLDVGSPLNLVESGAAGNNIICHAQYDIVS